MYDHVHIKLFHYSSSKDKYHHHNHHHRHHHHVEDYHLENPVARPHVEAPLPFVPVEPQQRATTVTRVIMPSSGADVTPSSKLCAIL